MFRIPVILLFLGTRLALDGKGRGESVRGGGVGRRLEGRRFLKRVPGAVHARDGVVLADEELFVGVEETPLQDPGQELLVQDLVSLVKQPTQ